MSGVDSQPSDQQGRAGAVTRPSIWTHFDDWFVQAALAPHVHIFCRWKVHPNTITAAALVLSAAIPVLHLYRLSWWVVASMLLRQFLDCLDGEVARQCHRLSKLGGILDTVADIVFAFSIVFILVSLSTPRPALIVLVSGLAFGGLFAIHVYLVRPSSLIDHSFKTADSPSLYVRSYAYIANNSLIFAMVIAVLYKLARP